MVMISHCYPMVTARLNSPQTEYRSDKYSLCHPLQMPASGWLSRSAWARSLSLSPLWNNSSLNFYRVLLLLLLLRLHRHREGGLARRCAERGAEEANIGNMGPANKVDALAFLYSFLTGPRSAGSAHPATYL